MRTAHARTRTDTLASANARTHAHGHSRARAPARIHARICTHTQIHAHTCMCIWDMHKRRKGPRAHASYPAHHNLLHAAAGQLLLRHGRLPPAPAPDLPGQTRKFAPEAAAMQDSSFTTAAHRSLSPHRRAVGRLPEKLCGGLRSVCRRDGWRQRDHAGGWRTQHHRPIVVHHAQLRLPAEPSDARGTRAAEASCIEPSARIACGPRAGMPAARWARAH